MTPNTPRQLSPYERNQLVRNGIDPATIDQYGDRPVEYITGRVEFAGHEFEVTPDVLIPRIETEELVAFVTTETTHFPQPLRLVDIGTGSGALGLSVAAWLYRQSWTFELDLVDVSSAALTVAKRNATQLGLPVEQLHWHQSDLLTAVSPDRTYHVVMANLPYIPTSRVAQLDSSVKDFEPILALDGGPTGSEVIQRLLSQLPPYLAQQHVVWLEIDHTHELPHLIGDLQGWQGQIVSDSMGRSRFARLTYQLPA